MPDFPQGKGTTPTDIWNHSGRTLTAITGQPRTDLMGEDANFEAGAGARKAKIDNVDAAISTRAPSGEYDTELDAQISSRAPASEYDAVLDDSISSRAPANEYDTELDATISSRAPEAGGNVAAIKTRADNIPAYETPVEASVLMDGSELNLVEKTDDKIGVLDGYVDLTPMASGDTIVIRQYMQIKAAGAYVKYAEETFVDAQSIPLLHVVTKTAKDKIKVTAEQTAGTNRTLDVQFYRRLQA